MSGVLHPVGPEPARTYWLRRGILLAVVLLLALGVVVAVASLTKAAVATAPPPTIAPAPASSPTATNSSGTSLAPSPAPSSPAGAPLSSAVPSSSAGASRAAVPTDSPTATDAPKPSTKPTAKPSPTATTIGTPDCQPSRLRVTVKADKTLSPGQKSTFRLTLSNGDQHACLASVTDKNFELKIYSGKDRIWSSRDCSKALDDFDKKLAAAAHVDWSMTWNGKRSVKGETCQKGAGTPQSGTYWATAQLKGADPVQLRMIIS